MRIFHYQLLLVIVFTTFTSQSQIVSIPDVNFKNKLLNHDPIIDSNSDGEIQITEAEVFTGAISVSGTASDPGGISDLTGIEAFINIDELQCDYNNLGNIDLGSNISLVHLSCNENPLVNLDVSNNLLLRNLSASGNLLSNIDVTNNPALLLLQCNFGNLTSLDVSNNPALEFLYIQNNQLTALDLTNNPNLSILICDNNQFTNMDLSGAPTMDFLYCRNTSLTDLDVSTNMDLKSIDCRSNQNLVYLNLKNGANNNMIITGSQSSNFEDLPFLETVCIDDVNSSLATFILDQVGHPVTFTENCILSMGETSLNDFLVYPNPVGQTLFLKARNPIINVEVYNLLGQLVLVKSSETDIHSIETSHLRIGTYLIKAIDLNAEFSIRKFIKH